MAPAERARAVAGFGDAVTVIGRAAVDGAIATLVDRRRQETEGKIAERASELDDVVAELEELTATRLRCAQEQDALRHRADWCEAQPEEAVAAEQAVPPAMRAIEACSADARNAGRALDDVLEQQATAEAALEEARAELDAPAVPGDTVSDTRREAVAALAQQAVTLEDQLARAVTGARTRSEEALRALAHAELVLERLRQEERARHRGLCDALAELPTDLRPPVGDDHLGRARDIAAALRAAAEQRQPELDALDREIDRLVVGRDRLHDELDHLRATLGDRAPGDGVGALRVLLDSVGPVPVVLDDPLTGAQWPAVLTDLTARPPQSTVVVLSTDPSVLEWAIDLPGAVGGVVDIDSARAAVGVAPARRAGAADAGLSDVVVSAEAATGAPRAPAFASTGPRHAADEPLVSLDRLRAFTVPDTSDPRSDDQP